LTELEHSDYIIYIFNIISNFKNVKIKILKIKLSRINICTDVHEIKSCYCQELQVCIKNIEIKKLKNQN